MVDEEAASADYDCRSVYRQSTQASREAQQRDAENKLLSHINRRRLFPEEIRDAMLQAPARST